MAGTRNTPWGIITDHCTVFTEAQLAAGTVTVTSAFSIWMAQDTPAAGTDTVFTSDRRMGALAVASRGATGSQQFAVFMNGSGVGTSGGLTTDAFGTVINSTDSGVKYYVGMKDNIN